MFSALTDSDTLVVEYRTSGCFHREANSFRFRREGTKLLVTAYDSGGFNRPNFWRKSQELGTIALTEDDIGQLDNLLSFYRERRKGASTTVDYVRMDLYRGGTRVGSEMFVDRTSILGLPKELAVQYKWPYVDALSFSTIRARIKKSPPGVRGPKSGA
jgi:hypothetical protein